MPIPSEYTIALDYLDANKDTALSSLASSSERTRVIAELREVVGRVYDRKSEDLRAVVTIAVDAAKTLTAIGIAFFVAVGGFMVQYVGTHTSIWSITFWCLVVSALCGGASMVAGFYAIGGAIKNAEGLTPATQNVATWSTAPMRRALISQSWAGLIGLIFFGVSLLFWSTPPTGGLSATPVQATSAPSATGHKIRVEGSWSNLTIRRGALSFSPAASNPPSQVQAFDIEVP